MDHGLSSFLFKVKHIEDWYVNNPEKHLTYTKDIESVDKSTVYTDL